MNKDYEKTLEFTPVYHMKYQDVEGSKASYTAYMLNFVQFIPGLHKHEKSSYVDTFCFGDLIMQNY